jgi:hypothetical protein
MCVQTLKLSLDIAQTINSIQIKKKAPTAEKNIEKRAEIKEIKSRL